MYDVIVIGSWNNKNKQMKMHIIDRRGYPDLGSETPALLLLPETESDTETLNRIAKKYKLCGVGCDPVTADVIHLEIELKRK